jgi:hypothetical protein
VADSLAITGSTLVELRAFRAEPKFQEDAAVVYPGAPDEIIRVRCESTLNGLVDRLIAGLPQNPTKAYVLGEFRATLEHFAAEDSEERDRVALYLERVMDIVGIQTSDGLLNQWRYGFDPPECHLTSSSSGRSYVIACAQQARHFIMRLLRAGQRSAPPLNCGVRRYMTSHAFLASVVEAWAPYAAQLESANVEVDLKIDEEHAKLGVGLRSDRLLGVLQAWEHAHCLDFDYMKLPSGEARMLFAGECESSVEMAQRLKSVFELVSGHHLGDEL